MTKNTIPLLLIMASTAQAVTNELNNNHIALDNPETMIRITNQNNREFVYTRQELQDNPEFTGKLLQLAVSNNNSELMQKILPAYAKANNNDKILVQYTQARLAVAKKDYAKAISHYKKILADNPNFDQIRLELALALFKDQQNINAKNQFNKLKSSTKTSPQIQKMIDSYLQALEQRNEWDIGASVNYISDKNINNVSDSEYVGSWKKPQSHLPQSAHGIGYNIGISKDFNIKDKHYFTLENYSNGEKYWDNKAYDDFTNRTYLGYRYKSADTSVSVLPFYKKNWNNNSDYDNYSTGIKAHGYHKIDPRFSLSLSVDYADNHYPQDDDFNGNNKSLSSTVYWQKSPKQGFYFGTSISDKKTNVKRFDSVTKSVHTGWNQEWNKGISSRLGLNYSKTKFGDMAKYGGVIPLGKVRDDDSYNANFTLWKRNWQIFNITPKLNFSYKKQDSNIADVYSYDKANVSIIFEKTF